MFDKENAGSNGANATIDTDVLHQVHQANSQMYDYLVKKSMRSYLMTELDIGPNLNVLTGFRNEKNVTIIFQRAPRSRASALDISTRRY